MNTSEEEPAAHAVAVRAAAALTKHSVVYAAGSAIVLILSLANTIALTQFLAASEFGRLGLALVAASFLTLAINAPLHTGALARAFGDVEEDGDEAGALASDRRRSFGSSVVATSIAATAILVLAVATVLVARASGSLEGETGDLVVLVALSGGAGAIWRLVSNPLRMQRRPVGHVLLSCVRPLLVLAIAIPLVAAGGSAVQALAGVAVGTVAANVVAAIAVRDSLAPALDGVELREIARRSIGYLPILGGVWLVQNVDLYLLAAFASASEVGQYRLASRLGATAAYASSAFFTAWGPLQLSEQFRAADEAYGHGTVRSTLAFYFALLSIGLLLALTLLAFELRSLAPAGYADAAVLVPLLGLAFTAQGVMVTAYRSAVFPHKGRSYRIALVVAACAFVPVCVLLITTLHTAGAALAATCVLLPVAAFLVRRSATAGHPLSLPVGRVVAAAALGAALLALARVSASMPTAIQVAAHGGALVAYLLAIPLIMPASHRRALKALLSAATPGRRAAGAAKPDQAGAFNEAAG